MLRHCAKAGGLGPGAAPGGHGQSQNGKGSGFKFRKLKSWAEVSSPVLSTGGLAPEYLYYGGNTPRLPKYAFPSFIGKASVGNEM